MLQEPKVHSAALDAGTVKYSSPPVKAKAVDSHSAYGKLSDGVEILIFVQACHVKHVLTVDPANFLLLLKSPISNVHVTSGQTVTWLNNTVVHMRHSRAVLLLQSRSINFGVQQVQRGSRRGSHCVVVCIVVRGTVTC